MTPKDDETSAHLNQHNSLTPISKKKPYEKPSFRFEKVFVTTALSCGKVNDGTGHCAGNPLLTGSAS
jgi:hypothetical protein